MAYKIMGVTAGRKNSNSEILLKEALMACEELGAEVRMINLKDFHIEPCPGCTSCTRGMAQCLLDDALVARARKMGENIMKAVATPPDERTWPGDEDMGWCPNCHSNALVLGEPQWDGIYYPIECQVCGCGGTLEKTPEGKWKFVIQENGYYKDRPTVIGRARHLEEIGHTEGGFYANPENLRIVNKKLAKYKDKQFPGLE